MVSFDHMLRYVLALIARAIRLRRALSMIKTYSITAYHYSCPLTYLHQLYNKTQ